MKTTNPTFLAKQLADSIEDQYRVELFEQFEGAITDRDSGIQIKVSGDATDLFSNGDVFIIALDDFETEHTITSTPTYSGGKTTIICSGSSFGTDIIDFHVAKKHNVTDDIMNQGISSIRIHTEGKMLNSFLADDITLKIDNDGGVYYSSDGDGLYNLGRIIWVKIFFKLKNDPTEFLCFGGTVYLPGIQPISDNETIEVLCTGHLKELERYPGWYLAEELGNLGKITGIELISITEPSGGTYEGIRKLNYKFPDGLDLQGLTINSLSSGTPRGFHIIKFQPYDLFQYDYGEWTQKTEGSTGETLTSVKGHTINIDLPLSFDIIAREDIFYVENRISREITAIGKPTLQFDNGFKQSIKFDFERFLRYDAGATAYEDITINACTFDSNQTDLFEAANDIVYIMSSELFLGIQFYLNTDLIGSFSFDYSRGYEDWGNLSVTDGTSGFSQDGVITWDMPSDWRKTDNLKGGVKYTNYFFIRITCSSYTSGSAKIIRALRYFRLLGSDGTMLNVKIKLEKLPKESREDTIIIKNDSTGIMQPCTWQQNISYQNYLELLLDYAGYTSSYRTIDNLTINALNKIISLYGRPPRNFYDKKVTALCIDTSSSPETIYLGIENELWKVDEKNSYTYIDELEPYIRGSDDAYFKVEIRRLVIDGNGYLQGIAWKDYFDQPIYGHDYSTDIDIGRRTPGIVFRSTNLTAITEQNQIDSGSDSILYTGEVNFRDGLRILNGSVYQYKIGQYAWAGWYAGENVILPVPQYLWHLDTATTSAQIENRYTLINTTSPGFNEYLVRMFSPGYYYVLNQVDKKIGLCFTLGQKGFVVWNESSDRWIFLRWNGTNWYVCNLNYLGVINTMQSMGSYDKQILCGCWSELYHYWASITWDDDGGTFPGDYSDCLIERMTNSGSTLVTLFDFSADTVEINQSLNSGDEYYCVVLDLIRNESENTLHGCLLNRNDFEYHYFVYDIANDKLYTTQTGSGFTFQNNRQIKEFIYNSNDNKVYSVVVDKRYDEEIAYLISAEYTAPVGSPDGTEITLTFEANIKENETDIVQLALGGGGRIYGISGNNDNYLFQYDDGMFYPRFFYGDTGEDSLRIIITEIAEAMNMIQSINVNRKIHFTQRETNKGSMEITQKDHYFRDTMSKIGSWAHRYDGVEVSWKNPITGESGVEKAGDFGWQRKILKIDNYFIQYPQLAILIAELCNDFFSQYRKEIGFKTIVLWQLENRDKFTFTHDGTFDFITSLEWMITELILDHWPYELEIKGLEIKS